MSVPMTVLAAPQYRFGAGEGRTDSVNINDYHTDSWERFWHNYFFTSGMDYRYDLGRPTSYMGFVPADVYSLNVRRDANTSLHPPRYGIFSGFIPTDFTNLLFVQGITPMDWITLNWDNPNMLTTFDTLFMGVNAANSGNNMNVQNAGAGGFLPPTSMMNP